MRHPQRRRFTFLIRLSFYQDEEIIKLIASLGFEIQINKQQKYLNQSSKMRNNFSTNEDSTTKISRSKSRNQVSAASKLKQKENGWNERFHLDHIPEYNYQNQPHSQYLKNKFRFPNRKNEQSKAKRIHEPSLDKNKVSNKPNPRKNQQKLKQAITNAFSELKSLWYEKSIPECHMQAMTKIFNRENNPMKIFQDIKYEYSQVSKESSLVQKIMESIATRQNCLQKIRELITNFPNVDKPKLTKQFEEKISHLRILTIHCIQCIFHWKQNIESLGPKGFKVKYIHNGDLYTKKVRDDYLNIINSSFQEIYKFQTQKLDPFFLNYTVDGKKIMNVSKNLIKRIRLCEIMLNQQNEQKNQDQKPTPLIEKLKSPPRQHQNRDKSVPPRGKTSVVIPWTKVPVEYGQLNEYIATILSKSEFKDSFTGQVELTKFQQVTVFRYSQTQEEIILGVDKYASQRKIVISVIKSTMEGVENLLKSLCQHLWQHDYCTQIRVSLVHRKIVEVFSVDPELEKKLKGVGFRWACVNHSGGTRITIYSLKRPLDTVAHKTSRRTQTYPVVIQHLVNFSLIERKQKKHPSRCFAAVLDTIRAVEQFQKQQYGQLCKRDEFYHHLDCIKKVTQYLKKQEGRQTNEQFFSYSGMKSFHIQNDQTLQKIFRNVQISSKRAKVPSVINLVNCCYKFKHITIQDGKYTKFFPSKDSQILIVQSNYPIYLLQTDEENINFFVIEVSEGFSMELIQSIFNGMGEQSSFIDQFWLPTFYKCEDYIDEVGFPSTQIVSTNYRNSLGSLTRKSKVRTKIIKPPFVFGMINKKLLELLQIPFHYTLVRKQDLI